MKTIALNGYSIPAAVFDLMLDHHKATLRSLACITNESPIPFKSVCGKAVQELFDRSLPLFEVCQDSERELASVIARQVNIIIFG
jgi:hypothetical protein